MFISAPVTAAWVWGRRCGIQQLRAPAWGRAALAAVTLSVVGQAFDLFAFLPDPARAGALGVQTGTLVGACWAVLGPPSVAAIRDPDDGGTAMLRNSVLGLTGLWWGAWGAQIALGIAMIAISVLTTTVFSMLSGLPLSIGVRSGIGAVGAVGLVGLIAAATTAWVGSVAGAVVGMAVFVAGQAGSDLLGRAFGPAPVGDPLTFLGALRFGVVAVGAVAIGQAGLRRLRD